MKKFFLLRIIFFSSRSVPVALPTEFTCKGVIAAKEAAAIALDEDDLEDWDADELRMCLPVLGKMRWDLEKKRSIWKLLTQNFVVSEIARAHSCDR